ncbi:MAG TPA: MarC family protein [Alphaproteobacteria bacterium]|nr:MarC family protein [Alphaproteobacteria bacterium]
MRYLLIHASITLFVIIDPVGVAPLFAALTEGRSAEERRRAAWIGVLVAALVLYVFALVGRAFLSALGVSIAAFRVAGGVLLFLVAIDMVFARQSGLRSTTRTEDDEAHHRADISVFPLAIPLIAGPGAIASVMLLMGEAGSWSGRGIILAVLTIVLALTYLLLRMAPRLVRLLGVTGTNVVGRVLGIILAAIAAQFIIDGIREVLGGIHA